MNSITITGNLGRYIADARKKLQMSQKCGIAQYRRLPQMRSLDDLKKTAQL